MSGKVCLSHFLPMILIVPYHFGLIVNADEIFRIFKGKVQISRETNDGSTIRDANDNEVMLEIFCDRKSLINNIWTENGGKFEGLIRVGIVQELINCNSIYIGFYAEKSKWHKAMFNVMQDQLNAKKSSVKKIFAQVATNSCLKFSERVCDDKYMQVMEYLMEQSNERIYFGEGEDENTFVVNFEQPYVRINNATEYATIVKENCFSDDLYRISCGYYAGKEKGESSASTDDQVEKSSSGLLKSVGKRGKKLLGKKNKNKVPNFADEISDK